VPVEVSGREALARRKPQEERCELEVILTKGRRIELSRNFDPMELRQAVEVLEG